MKTWAHWVLLAAASAATGCYAYAEPEPVTATYEVTSAPPDVEIESAPYVVYEGHPTYWYGGRWYYRDRDDRRWRYYREEPPTLQRQRPYVQQAPPARRRR